MYSKEEIKNTKLEFWKKLDNRTRRLPGQKGAVKKWIFDQTGIKGIDLRFDVTKQHAIVALEVNHKDDDRRLYLYEKLDSCKTLFEDAFGESLEWHLSYDKDNGRNVSRICKTINQNYLDKEQWSTIIPFLVFNMLNMENAFNEVKDFLQYDELGQ